MDSEIEIHEQQQIAYNHYYIYGSSKFQPSQMENSKIIVQIKEYSASIEFCFLHT